MESPSQAPHSGGSTWKGFLLTASILSCWIQPTSAQSVSVVPNPPYGTVGSSVILDIKGLSEHPLSYAWYRRELDPSNQMAFYNVASGQPTVTDSRLNVFSNGSLLISNLRLNDTENYIALLINSNAQIQTIRGPLVVYEIVSKPIITANSTNVLENTTLVITCVTEHQGINILWFFNNESLSLNERKYLSENNQMLTITNVRREDAGSYQCEVWNPISNNRSDPLTLTVNYGPDSITFSPSSEGDKIQVTINNPLTLVCQVESYPPAQYEWRVNGTVNSNFSDNMYTINSTSWEDSGSYTCLAWNNVTNLSVSKVVTVSIEKVSPGRGQASITIQRRTVQHPNMVRTPPCRKTLLVKKAQLCLHRAWTPPLLFLKSNLRVPIRHWTEPKWMFMRRSVPGRTLKLKEERKGPRDVVTAFLFPFIKEGSEESLRKEI
ncbi:cell adhesion molecule CEACAM6-like isoform X1 [Notamacropus eugenii]|uniref:cell adhesion molecule CEACAM6-like isoform X1 n=1 Tax=Notamacropus eugenii TaxID=9315 RepID=UPI003B67AE58